MSHQSPIPTTVERHLQLWIYLLPVVGLIPAVWTLYRAEKSTLDLSQSDREARAGGNAASQAAYSTLARKHCALQSRQKKVSRLSINLSLIWLSSYVLCFWGADRASEILSFRLLYLNTIITSGYFLTCTYLMLRLSKKNSLSSDKSD